MLKCTEHFNIVHRTESKENNADTIGIVKIIIYFTDGWLSGKHTFKACSKTLANPPEC